MSTPTARPAATVLGAGPRSGARRGRLADYPCTAVRLRPGEHTDWCARDHRCNLGEHRADPVTLQAPGRGVTVLTRVLAADGSQHVEIRCRIRLADGEQNARAHLARIVAGLDAHLRQAVIRLRR